MRRADTKVKVIGAVERKSLACETRYIVGWWVYGGMMGIW